MRYADTVRDAIKHYLTQKRNKGKITARRYNISGGTCQIFRGRSASSKYPTLKWLTAMPESYIGVDLTEQIRIYMTPYARPNVAKSKPVEIPDERVVIEHGARVPQLNDEHYQQIMSKLDAGKLFPTEKGDVYK